MGRSVRRAVVVALVLAIGAAGGPSAGGTTIRGRVFGDDGQPAAGARVWAIKNHFSRPERHEVAADAAGRFAIEVATEPYQWFIEANHNDQGTPRDVAVAVNDRDPEPTTIRLRPGGRLRGRLIEAETGQPIAGGRFFLDNGEVPVSDPDGRFEVAGQSRLRLHEAIAVAPGRVRTHVLFEIADGSTTDLEVSLPRGAKAIGLVLDPDGRPIPGATIGQTVQGDQTVVNGLCIRSDAHGRFVYDGLRPGQATSFTVWADGFLNTYRPNVRPGPHGEPTAQFIRLHPLVPNQTPAVGFGRPAAPPPPPTQVVSGIVTGPDGAPAAGVLVLWGFNRQSGVPEARTDAAGRFRLPPTVKQVGDLCLYPPGSDLAPSVAAFTADGDQEIPIKMPRGRTITGVIRNDTGTPLPHVTVTPWIIKPNEWSMFLLDRECQTDAAGRFVLAGLPGANVHANFSADGYNDQHQRPLVADRENDVTMVARGVIRGRVVDEAGQPVRNFRVQLSCSRQTLAGDKPVAFPSINMLCGFGASFTAADGSFLLRDLNAGAVHRVTVLAPGHGSATLDRVLAEPHNHPPAAAPPTFRLGPTRSLAVRVSDATSGAPIPSARVTLVHDGPMFDPFPDSGYRDNNTSDSVHADADPSGMAELAAIGFGEGSVLVRAPGYLDRHVGWRDGGRAVIVALRAEATLAGEVLDRAKSLPIEGLYGRLSTVLTDGRNWNQGFQTDADGRFRLGALAEGRYTLSVFANNQQILNEQITLEVGQQVRRQFRLSLADPAADTDLAPAP